MSTEQRHKPFGDATAGSIAPPQHPASRVIAGPHYEEPAREPAEWQDHLRSLQQWVCELLIKNQKLRLALESAMGRRRRFLIGIDLPGATERRALLTRR